MKREQFSAMILAFLMLESNGSAKQIASLELRRSEALAAGKIALAANLQRSIDNHRFNPIVARVTLQMNPTLATLQEQAAKLTRNPEISTDPKTGKVKPAQIGLIIDNGSAMQIDLTRGGLLQLTKDGVPQHLLSTIAPGQTFEADVEFREMGEWIDDTSSAGRREDLELQIQTGNAVIVNQRVVITKAFNTGTMQILQVQATAHAIATAHADDVSSATRTPRADHRRVKGTTGTGITPPPAWEFPERTEKDTDEKYANKVEKSKLAYSVKYNVPVDAIVENINVGG